MIMTEKNEKSEIIYIVENKDTEKLLNFLKELDIVEIYRYLIDAHITYRSLPYLSKEDLMIIPHTGLRAEFREKLFEWRNRRIVKEEIHSTQTESKVNVWLQESDPFNNETESQEQTFSKAKHFSETGNSNTPSNQISKRRCSNTSSNQISAKRVCSNNSPNKVLDVKKLFQESFKGKTILQNYEQNKCLVYVERNDIINVILEVVFCSKITLTPTYFDDLLRQIIEIFPTEVDFQDYYYVPRTKNRNPRGRLYDRYKNTRAKMKKQEEQKGTPKAVEPVKIEMFDDYDQTHD